MSVFIRGGNWNNGSNAGAFTLNLNWDTGNTNNNVGFRCARYLSIKTLYKLFGPNGISTDSASPLRRSAFSKRLRNFGWFREQVCAKTATAFIPSLVPHEMAVSPILQGKGKTQIRSSVPLFVLSSSGAELEDTIF